MKSAHKKRVNTIKELKPFIEEFAAVGIKLRIERGDFKSDACRVNGELHVFINKKLALNDQKKMLEDLKQRDDIKASFENK